VAKYRIQKKLRRMVGVLIRKETAVKLRLWKMRHCEEQKTGAKNCEPW
jgi:hypothetical protein